ncbi:MAG TPA: hypothetical protein PLO51_01475, partial [Candidatus Micrarchaeota archaeon]|nr:hypothetical protein [Candidatus Micrarchaeota archaeon]
ISDPIGLNTSTCQYSLDNGASFTALASCANATINFTTNGTYRVRVYASNNLGAQGYSDSVIYVYTAQALVVVNSSTTNVSSSNTLLILNSSTPATNISVPSNSTNVTLDLNGAANVSGNLTTAIIINPISAVVNTVSLGAVTFSLPANLTITGSNWTGVLSLPTVAAVPAANITAAPGMSVSSVDGAVSVGFTQGLNLSSAARLLIPGKSGKYAGYIDSAGTFHTITTTCNADSQATVDSQLAAGGECKINVGSDLVIWTKHFTTFVAYSQTSTGDGSGGSPSNGVGGGSGGIGSFSTTSSTGSTSTVLFGNTAVPYTSSVTVSPSNVTTVSFTITNNKSFAFENFQVSVGVPASFATNPGDLTFNMQPTSFGSNPLTPAWNFSLLNPGESLVLFFSANKPTLLTASDFKLSMVQAQATGAQPVANATGTLAEGTLTGPATAYAGDSVTVTFAPKAGTQAGGVVVLVTDPNRQVSEYTTDASGLITLQNAIEGNYMFSLKNGILSKAYSLSVMAKPTTPQVPVKPPAVPTNATTTPPASSSNNQALLFGVGLGALVIGLIVLVIVIVALYMVFGRKKKKGL